MIIMIIISSSSVKALLDIYNLAYNWLTPIIPQGKTENLLNLFCFFYIIKNIIEWMAIHWHCKTFFIKYMTDEAY